MLEHEQECGSDPQAVLMTIHRAQNWARRYNSVLVLHVCYVVVPFARDARQGDLMPPCVHASACGFDLTCSEPRNVSHMRDLQLVIRTDVEIL